jgi:hypothetical protein
MNIQSEILYSSAGVGTIAASASVGVIIINASAASKAVI